MANSERASKKQRELLLFVDGFIKGNGYGPSYREVMRALGYKSVSTVAVHVDGLIARGYLRKADNAARSIEIVEQPIISKTNETQHTTWLVKRVKQKIDEGVSDEERETLEQALKLLDVPLD